MKTPRLLTLLAAAMLCAASPQSSPAADFVVDISSFAPRDPEVILRQIDLNVALKQYEKALTDVYDARLQLEIGPTESGLTDDQTKAHRVRAEVKLKYLENTMLDLRARIAGYLKEANEKAQAIEKAKAASAPAKDEPRG